MEANKQPVERKEISMSEAIKTYFTPAEKGWNCKLCGYNAWSITGISVHWRKNHQHDSRIFIV